MACEPPDSTSVVWAAAGAAAGAAAVGAAGAGGSVPGELAAAAVLQGSDSTGRPAGAAIGEELAAAVGGQSAGADDGGDQLVLAASCESSLCGLEGDALHMSCSTSCYLEGGAAGQEVWEEPSVQGVGQDQQVSTEGVGHDAGEDFVTLSLGQASVFLLLLQDLELEGRDSKRSQCPICKFITRRA
jgi:hypothetical protein